MFYPVYRVVVVLQCGLFVNQQITEFSCPIKWGCLANTLNWNKNGL